MSGEGRAATGESPTPLPAGRIARVQGTALVLRGDDVDTDRIMPARFLRVVTFEGLGDHVFEDDRKACADRGQVHPFDLPHAAGAAILIVNRNFGCGSSREHAPQGLLRRGIRAIVGTSFSEIFFGNATSLGLACLSASTDSVGALMQLVEGRPGNTVTVDLDLMKVRSGGFEAPIDLPRAVRDAFLDGTWDATGLLLDDFAQVRDLAARLPYIRGFN